MKFNSFRIYCRQAPDDKEIVVDVGFTEELKARLSKTTTDLAQLRATHEEADTRLVLHAMYSQFNTVGVSSRDTNVLVLLIANFLRVLCERLWMLSGTAKKRQYIPIDAVFQNLRRGSGTNLLQFHALTGCESTSFLRITPKGPHGKSPQSIINCSDTLESVNSQRKPFDLQKHLSSEYMVCTNQTLLILQCIYCSLRMGNQKQ